MVLLLAATDGRDVHRTLSRKETCSLYRSGERLTSLFFFAMHIAERLAHQARTAGALEVHCDEGWDLRFEADEAFIMLIRLRGRMSVQFWLM